MLGFGFVVVLFALSWFLVFTYVFATEKFGRIARPTIPNPIDQITRDLAFVAAKLGLAVDALTLHGRLRGPDIAVTADVRAFPLGPMEWRFEYRATARIEPPLGLGLSIIAVEEQHFMEREAAPLEDIVSRKFDGGFHVELRDLSRARSLIGGRAEDLLLAALALEQYATVTDSSVSLRIAHRLSADVLADFIQTAAEIADALGRARGALPSLSPAEQAWTEIASELGARWDAESSRLDLDGDHGALRISARSDDSSVRIALRFDRPLPVELHLTNASAVPRWDRVTGQDIQLGDRIFDDAFVVRCADEPGTRALLDAEARQALTQLLSRAERLVLSPTSLELEVSAQHRDARALRDRLALIDAVAAALTPKRPASAYR